MFIKSVKIHGFKAFDDTVIFGDFSPNKNCIFGLNGSGKSCFYSAIEFVFLDEFSHLRPADRQSLLHLNGSYTKIPEAFVEITFDNQSQRLPVNSNEVTIRRSIGINKDEYFIQRKHTTRQDIMNLFETANYSLGLGLFSVRQGKVKAVAEMKDSERLELFYEISGIHTYDDQKKESMQMLAQAEMRRERINQSIEDIDRKMEQIMAEKEELERYEEICRLKKALEYILYESEKKKVEEELQRKEADILNESSVLNNIQKQYDEISNDVSLLEQKSLRLESKIQQNNQEKMRMEHKRDEMIRTMTQSKHNVQILKQKQETAQNTVEMIEKKIVEFSNHISILKEDIKSYEKDCETLNNRKYQLEAILSKNDVYKVTESKLFEVNQEINDISKNIIELKEGSKDKMENFKKELKNIEEELHQNINEKEYLNNRYEEIQSEKIKLYNERKKLFKDQFQLEQKRILMQQSLQKSLENFYNLMGESKNIIKFIQDNYSEDPEYFGQLIDLISFDENLDFAIDSSVGKKLFYIVVGTDDLAMKISNSIEENNIIGNLSIVVLNRVNGSKKEIPNTSTIEPLIDRIVYDNKFEKLIQMFFGSIGLCSTISVGSEYSAAEEINCVTFTGDLALASGIIKGGSQSIKRSICRTKRRLDMKKIPLQKVIHNINDINKEIDQVNASIMEIDSNLAAIESSINKTARNIQNLQAKSYGIKQKIEEIDNSILYYKQLKNDKKNYRKELENGIKILEQNREETEGKSISSSIESQQKELTEVSTKLTVKKFELHLIKSEYNELLKIINQKNNDLFELKEKRLQQLKGKTDKEKKVIKEMIAAYENEKNEINEMEENLNLKKSKITKQLKFKRKMKDDCRKKLSYEQSRVEDLTMQKQILLTKIDETTKNIAILGTLPITIIENWKNESYDAILEKLNDINSMLKNYKNINKKAIHQYKQFESQLNELKERQNDIQESIKPIKKLIKKMEKNKEKAITKAFATISENFTSTYSKLNTGALARLALITNDSFFDDEFHEINNNDFIGISIKVDGIGIETMSGGEKTLIAIALLLAIQQTDSSPFYLFDEIDSDLDPQSRESLAKLIDEMTANIDPSKHSQFIFTTHRSELMAISDQFFSVQYLNGYGRVQEASRDEALLYTVDND